MPHLEGRELGGCKLLRKLGAGGMGEVYLAEQRRLGNRLVAVKVVSPEDATFHPDVADDMARRFQREAALLGQLSHPNILPVHDSGVERNLLYLVMDYAPEGSLADALRGGKQKLTLPVSLPLALDIISQIAAALQYTHDHGVVHRDVKPGNVLIRIESTGHWRMLLADFGVARDMDTSSQKTQISGTFAFMAPEQFSGKFSPASDQYALAVMAFQLLSGRTPFEGDLASLTRAHMYDPPPSLHALNPRVPAGLDAVIGRALAKDPAARYPSVTAFAEALRAAAGTGAPPDHVTRPAEDVAALAPATALPITQATTQAAVPANAVTQRARRRSTATRVLVTVLAVVLLVAGVFGGSQLLQQRANANTPQPTQTAQSITPSPTATVAVTPVATFAACATAPTDVGADVHCLPAIPTGYAQAVLAEAAPSCPQSTAQWQTENKTQKSCTADGTVIAPTTGQQAVTASLACLDARNVSVKDGFVATLVSHHSGGVAIGFREQLGDATQTGNYIAGYYLLLYTEPGKNTITQYELLALDAQGQSHQVGAVGSLDKPLADHFAVGVDFTGTQFALYVNGQQVSTFADTQSVSSGWIGLCTLGGSAAFSSMELFQPGS